MRTPAVIAALFLGSLLAGCGRDAPTSPRLSRPDGSRLDAPDASAAPGDAAQPADASVARRDAGPADAGSADAGREDASLLSIVFFEDAQDTTGNPRKISVSTPDEMDTDNLVRLYVSPLKTGLVLTWGTTLGKLSALEGAETTLVSPDEGTAKVTCWAYDPVRDERQSSSIELQVRKPQRTTPILRGESVVWAGRDLGVYVARVPNGAASRLGEGTLADFDGRYVALKSRAFGDKSIVVYDLRTFDAHVIAPPSLSSSWDYRSVAVGGDRLSWMTADASYSQLSLYTWPLWDGPEAFVAGPEAFTSSCADRGKLLFVARDSAGDAVHRIYDPATGAVTAAADLDGWGTATSWHEPLVILTGPSGTVLVDRNLREAWTVQSTLGSIVEAEVSEGYYGGHAREPFGTRGEVFISGNLGEKRHPLPTNDFVFPSVDGNRVVWAFENRIWMLEAP